MAQLFAAERAPSASGSRGVPPRFSLSVSRSNTGGWHSAILVREAAMPEFFVRSLAVPRPFVIARPVRSNRQRGTAFKPQELSPAHTSPSRRLVVNWGWERRDDGTDQLRIYVKCKGRMLFWRRRKLAMKLRLKEQAPPHRRIVLLVSSEPVEWRGGPADAFVPEHAVAPDHAVSPVEW